MEWIERELREANEDRERVVEKSSRVTPPSPAPAAPGRGKDATSSTTTIVAVKDLDAKIDFLRAREEEVARANAERVRIEEEEREAAEARRAEEARWVQERIEMDDARRTAAAAAAAAAAEKVFDEEMARRTEVEMAAQKRRADADEAVRTPSDERERPPLPRGFTYDDDAQEGRRAAASPGLNEMAKYMDDDVVVADVVRARQQPKSSEEERKLQEKYGNMEDLEERAFRILVDLGMVDLHTDPADEMTLDSEEDE